MGTPDLRKRTKIAVAASRGRAIRRLRARSVLMGLLTGAGSIAAFATGMVLVAPASWIQPAVPTQASLPDAESGASGGGQYARRDIPSDPLDISLPHSRSAGNQNYARCDIPPGPLDTGEIGGGQNNALPPDLAPETMPDYVAGPASGETEAGPGAAFEGSGRNITAGLSRGPGVRGAQGHFRGGRFIPARNNFEAGNAGNAGNAGEDFDPTTNSVLPAAFNGTPEDGGNPDNDSGSSSRERSPQAVIRNLPIPIASDPPPPLAALAPDFPDDMEESNNDPASPTDNPGDTSITSSPPGQDSQGAGSDMAHDVPEPGPVSLFLSGLPVIWRLRKFRRAH